jgi:hypothetical protein
VAFLKEQLPAIPRLSEKLARLIAELDDEEIEVRERSSNELGRLGGLAESALRKTLHADPPLEVRRRIEALLEPLDKMCWPGMSLQGWRAIAVLERVGTDDARQVLEELAEGDPEARLTQEAKAAAERLGRRHGGWKQHCKRNRPPARVADWTSLHCECYTT